MWGGLDRSKNANKHDANDKRDCVSSGDKLGEKAMVYMDMYLQMRNNSLSFVI